MDPSRSIPEQTVVVILAAGKGTRMGRSDLVKVCFEIDGVPAINRQIDVFKRQRFQRFLTVVGPRADQVMETVSREHQGVLFVHQEPQLGTGHAAKIAAEALQAIGYQDYVLVTMGDKHIEPSALAALVDGYVKQRADFALLTIPKTVHTEASAGRVIVSADGQAQDIIEQVDLARQMIADDLRAILGQNEKVTGAGVVAVIARYIPRPQKQQAAVPELLGLASSKSDVDRSRLEKVLLADKYNLAIDGRRYSGREIEKLSAGVNPSLYLMKADVFYQGVGMIRNDNAQGEYYITDMVRLLSAVRDSNAAPRYRVRAVPVDHPEWVQSFNSPDELLAIQDYVRQQHTRRRAPPEAVSRPRLKSSQYATVRQWLSRLDAARPAVRRWLERIYGRHANLHRQKCKDLRDVLECYAKRFGAEEKVCIVRAPGRVNLMGRHVDHRGGITNFLAIDRETLTVVGLRDDDQVVAVNTQPGKYKSVRFSISELMGRMGWQDWLDFVNSDWVRNIVYVSAGHWGNYIKAAMLRLQHRYQDVRVRGLNMAISGNIPVAAGLSSSSSIVVATLQSAIALNNFDVTSQQFIDLCGEGEWFVGSRGGAGDHAAIHLGQRGKIVQVGYLPFRVEQMIDAPTDYQIVIANSHVKAAKSASARDEFNSRITAYNLGLALLKQRCPEIAATVEHLRDIDPAKLGYPISDIYRWLLRVPETMTRTDFRVMLSREHERLIESSFATHAEPPAYHPRGVLLFGIAEILRGRMCVDLLQAGRVDEFGTLMKVSHDGDRVSQVAPDGAYHRIASDCSDEQLQRLIADLGSENPQRVFRGQLFMQPGAYACSTPEIDQMVDIACRVPGVAGAQIAGAGLGGCIMALVRHESVPLLRKALAADYYRPRGLEPAAIPCVGVEGAGVVEF
ncbi:MAG: NTP transferase domain-containing protein [Planctomycetaceae bacterium]|nr:NTP transferase domain-containing protein [Planctomycetaceae bacterium]